MGIINRRGRIVTVIDMGKFLGLTPVEFGERMRTIIDNDGKVSFCLMVDDIGKLVAVASGRVEEPPANIGDVPGRCFTGVFKT